MALDEALMILSDLPVLRVYPSRFEGVIIGRFQQLEDEIYYKTCIEDEIEVVRRISGGGSVFKVPNGEINYSLILPLKDFPIFLDVKKAYMLILFRIKKALESMFDDVEISIYPGSNDLVINNQKISGNAQARKYNKVLVHGTVLISINKDRMFRYIKMPREKYLARGFSHPEDFVTDLVTHSRRRYEVETICDNFIKFFDRWLNLSIYYDSLTVEEKSLTCELVQSKYSNPEWLFNRRYERRDLP